MRGLVAGGDAKAMRVLGIRLLEGKPIQQIPEEGQQLLIQAAERGDVVAMKELGDRLLEGDVFPQDSTKGENWLRKAAETGDPNSLVLLGSRLIDGRDLAVNLEEGEKLLRRAAESEDPNAMRTLSERLLDGKGLVRNAEEGERWLRKAVEMDNISAMIDLGERLLDGEGMEQNVQRGEKWLRKAAARGDTQAMISLGSRLVDGEGITKNMDEGMRWLQDAATSGDPDGYALIGRIQYTQGDYRTATETLLNGFKQGSHVAGNNLTYMVRRGEVPIDITVPPVADLLAKGLKSMELFALINYALCIASGFQYSEDWSSADDIIRSLSHSSATASEALRWWNLQLGIKKDPEGDLVVGWLARHHLIEDPDGKSVADRMAKARAGGWNVPAWLDDFASTPENAK